MNIPNILYSRKFPNITYFYSIGKSVNGRDLPVIAIASEARYDDFNIPDFKFIANVHGNEVIGLELLLILVQVLLENYGKNEYLTKLINTTSIHIMPTMNPDGYENYRSDKTNPNAGFTNANMVDLETDFPYQQQKNTKLLQPETQAVMKWTKTIPFLLSANLRDGAYFVSYPSYNCSRKNGACRNRDHRLLVRLAYEYMHLQLPHFNQVKADCPLQDNSNSRILNEAEYSPKIDTMQNWNYINSNCIELTFFLHCQQISSSNTLRQLWDMHKYSLINYISQIHQSLNGYVRNRNTGLGIQGVEVNVKGSGKPVYSQNNGAFFRLLNPGTYTVLFTHPLYVTVKQQFKITAGPSTKRKAIILMTSVNVSNANQHVDDHKYVIDTRAAVTLNMQLSNISQLNPVLTLPASVDISSNCCCKFLANTFAVTMLISLVPVF
uniref:Peptidase_M14 domain-containing protein n=1 Tax=Syphacia muris TaxID=451379 RepID=A0A0N5AL08_9BILA